MAIDKTSWQPRDRNYPSKFKLLKSLYTFCPWIEAQPKFSVLTDNLNFLVRYFPTEITFLCSFLTQDYKCFPEDFGDPSPFCLG